MKSIDEILGKVALAAGAASAALMLSGCLYIPTTYRFVRRPDDEIYNKDHKDELPFDNDIYRKETLEEYIKENYRREKPEITISKEE